jgi:sialic acid synthase
MRALTIGGRQISDDTHAFVVAEIGHNHQGDVRLAHTLIDQVADAGATAIKLQTRDNRTLFSSGFYQQPYDDTHAFGATYGAHREALELPRPAYHELIAHARERGLLLLSTAFDQSSADFLASLGVPAIKIASGDVTNLPLLRHVATLGLPLILSTGGATQDDIDRAFETILVSTSQLALLQCTAHYPTRTADLHLRVIATFRDRYPSLVIGLSDHHPGLTPLAAAYALGARIFEKHVTLDRGLKGRDHAFSLRPRDLRRMVKRLSQTHAALGAREKQTTPEERVNLRKMAKCLTAARDLAAGHVLTPDDFLVQSPAGGLPPFWIDRLVGVALTQAIRSGDQFSPTHVGVLRDA